LLTSPGIVSGLAAGVVGSAGWSWLGLRVVPADVGGGFGSGPIPGRGAGLGILAGGAGIAGPGGKPFPQRGDLMLAQSYPGECPVIHLVQLQSGGGEILAGQARIRRRAKPISWAGLYRCSVAATSA
jgi:hypothetical protein